jgi:hypothetical protein
MVRLLVQAGANVDACLTGRCNGIPAIARFFAQDGVSPAVAADIAQILIGTGVL